MRARDAGPILLLALLAVLGSIRLAAAEGGAPEAGAILGQWRGTSVCTNREIAPACKDEQILYTFTRAEGAEGKVHQKAEKLVDGQFGLMGELDFDYVSSERRWKCELQNSRVHIVWSLAVDGDHLSGTAVDVPSGGVLRKVSAARTK
jgi:hypothetical protein